MLFYLFKAFDYNHKLDYFLAYATCSELPFNICTRNIILISDPKEFFFLQK